jgi:hypothetical protein
MVGLRLQAVADSLSIIDRASDQNEEVTPAPAPARRQHATPSKSATKTDVYPPRTQRAIDELKEIWGQKHLKQAKWSVQFKAAIVNCKEAAGKDTSAPKPWYKHLRDDALMRDIAKETLDNEPRVRASYHKLIDYNGWSREAMFDAFGPKSLLTTDFCATLLAEAKNGVASPHVLHEYMRRADKQNLHRTPTKAATQTIWYKADIEAGRRLRQQEEQEEHEDHKVQEQEGRMVSSRKRRRTEMGDEHGGRGNEFARHLLATADGARDSSDDDTVDDDVAFTPDGDDNAAAARGGVMLGHDGYHSPAEFSYLNVDDGPAAALNEAEDHPTQDFGHNSPTPCKLHYDLTSRRE